MNKPPSEHSCGLCGHATTYRPFHTLPAAIFGTRSAIYRCGACGGGCTVPAPQTLGDYYTEQPRYEAEFATKSQLYKRFADNLLDFAEDGARTLGKSIARGRLLDVGAGRGWLVERARARGFDAIGLELNRANVHAARRDGVALYESLDELLMHHKLQSFDIVVFSAVIEHVSDPASFMAANLAPLRPGGLVVISQAAFDGLLPTWAPWLWYGWQPKEHYWHFDETALRMLLERVGIGRVLISRSSLHHPVACSTSLKELLGRNLASALGRLGNRLSRGDQLYAAGTWNS